MLGKLLKYEFKATSRMLPLIYAGVLIFSVLLGFSSRDGFILNDGSFYSPVMEKVFVLMVILYMIMIVGLIGITAIMILERFYRNMLKGEGYLMHTLPVPTWMHVASKTITAMVWEILAVIVFFVSALLIVLCSGELVGADLRDILQAIFDNIDIFTGMNLLRLVVSILELLVGFAASILFFYAAMAIGGAFNRHKVLYSVLVYLGINIIKSIINAVFSLGPISRILAVTVDTNGVSPDGLSVDMQTMMYMLQGIGINLVYGAIAFALTVYFLQKKLNLE